MKIYEVTRTYYSTSTIHVAAESQEEAEKLICGADLFSGEKEEMVDSDDTWYQLREDEEMPIYVYTKNGEVETKTLIP